MPATSPIRLVAARKIANASKRSAKIHDVVADAARRLVGGEKDAAVRRDTFSNLLVLLAREHLEDEAIGLLSAQDAARDPLAIAISLADALTILPADSKLSRQSDGLLRVALANNSRSPDLLYSVANMKYVRGSRDEAVNLYRTALELKPDHKLAMNNLALALADRPENLPEAFDTVNRAIKKFGPDAGLLDTKGQILVLLGRTQEGLVLLNEAVSSQPGDALVLLHLSNAYLAAGKGMEARTVYRRARALNVGALIITANDRAILARLESHIRQTASGG